MKRIAKPNTDTTAYEKAKEIEVPLVSDISIQRLIDDSLTVLYREIKNLMKLSVPGKLDPNDARDLRDHLKLLFELKEREKERLDGITDEQLKIALTDMIKDMSDDELKDLLKDRTNITWTLQENKD